ncbi:CAP domain-containing protein [Candidatus Nitrosocosmicus hydrocola]|uniref:CAP domain-containing protein n=1 Tax=Candidatus Nitrosocosmicus hydrocola TaxID=1826872 RepID=UPI00137345BA|nr:CAP domain-containing protein [Candidatus Nitrosocosmicus hydrocola]
MKISSKITMIVIMTVVLTVPSTMLQISQAQLSASDQTTILTIHNNERSAVGNSPLVWSNSLATQSQDYANQLSTMGLVCNAQKCDRTPHGATNENLAGGSPGTSITTHVQGWAKEKAVYNGQPIPSGNNPAGHYTAMVWQNTQEIGCGFASSGQMDFLVCRYNPPGNFIGEMPYGNSNQAVIDDETTFVPNGGVTESVDSGVSNVGNSGSEDSGDSGSEDSGDSGSEDSGDSGSEDSGDSGSEDSGDSGSEDSGDSGSEEGNEN